MLGPLVWVHLVMYRPVLLPDRAVADVVRDVEELAGHMADLLAADSPQPPAALAAANRVLDECCLFVERWTLGSERLNAFRGDVVRLRMRLDVIANRLVPAADLDSGQMAS
ncbi:hypothetical protein JOF56_005779 [Kibdelosporangium banguiense]|uniref:Uncharacterized protein n=1 Tax=Kibdelosporangium banguiense TaxID=1365924 RepID=A0ABS4TM25_9PSEU|nr:hypothetical protein [Kibdelosporangium banguiense]MBP2325394.1 hypothetical protein [Kibdelosporangium banguiense]